MRIVHVIPTMSDMGFSGVSAALAQLVLSQAKMGAEIEILTLFESGNPEDVGRVAPYLSRSERTRWWQVSTIAGDSLRAVAHADVVHLHALWKNWLAAHAAMLFSKPYVVTPHGMLDEWALRRSAWKKKIVRSLMEDRILSRAGCIHALCSAEAQSILAQNIDAPIAVIPHGIDLDALRPGDAGGPEEPSVPIPNAPFVLFMGRLHSKKGLAVLINAWTEVVARHPEWRLVVAGPDQEGLMASLQAMAARANVLATISFPGGVYRTSKTRLLRAASAFVLPSFSEGVPVAVLEAMACGLPVAITHACNLPEVAEAGAGLIGDPTVESVTGLLCKIIELPPEDRAAMGGRGRSLVENRFERDGAAAELMRVYSWLIEGGGRPASLLGRSSQRAAS